MFGLSKALVWGLALSSLVSAKDTCSSPLEVVFVLDNSVNKCDHLSKLYGRLKLLVYRIKEEKVDVRMGIALSDKSVALPFTNDYVKFLTSVMDITSKGCSSVRTWTDDQVLQHVLSQPAINSSWTPGARHAILQLTDSKNTCSDMSEMSKNLLTASDVTYFSLFHPLDVVRLDRNPNAKPIGNYGKPDGQKRILPVGENVIDITEKPDGKPDEKVHGRPVARTPIDISEKQVVEKGIPPFEKDKLELQKEQNDVSPPVIRERILFPNDIDAYLAEVPINDNFVLIEEKQTDLVKDQGKSNRKDSKSLKEQSKYSQKAEKSMGKPDSKVSSEVNQKKGHVKRHLNQEKEGGKDKQVLMDPLSEEILIEDKRVAADVKKREIIVGTVSTLGGIAKKPTFGAHEETIQKMEVTECNDKFNFASFNSEQKVESLVKELIKFAQYCPPKGPEDPPKPPAPEDPKKPPVPNDPPKPPATGDQQEPEDSEESKDSEDPPKPPSTQNPPKTNPDPAPAPVPNIPEQEESVVQKSTNSNSQQPVAAGAELPKAPEVDEDEIAQSATEEQKTESVPDPKDSNTTQSDNSSIIGPAVGGGVGAAAAAALVYFYRTRGRKQSNELPETTENQAKFIRENPLYAVKVDKHENPFYEGPALS